MTCREWGARIAMVGLSLVVCGCDGHVSSASGTPAGPAPSYDSFVGLNKNVTLQTSSTAITSKFDSINGTSPNSIARDPKGGFGDGAVTISYDAASQTYTIRDAANAISYAPADKIAGSDPTASPFDTYVHRNGQITDTIRAYRAGGTSTQFPQLSYTTFVIANRSTVTGQSGISQQFSDQRLIYAVGGFETVRSDLPKTGTASYSSFVTGTTTNVGASQSVGGSATITADFGAASVSTSLGLTANGQSIGTFTGVAPIETATSHFKGDLSANGATQGSFAGSFFGPQAAEIGFTYRVQTSIGTVDGGAVGKK